ncbi:MAG: hypothetical protein KDA89_02960, partial [Planctomycetaceae bacterium]|nr:hypothetical protein [Planctomycetaceae bacterium]
MANHEEPTVQATPLVQLNEIDEICDAFEQSWKQGRKPDISDFLKQSTAASWPTLFVELVRVDIAYRALSGEFPTVNEYVRRFPQFATHLSTSTFDLPTDSQIRRLADLQQIGSLKLLQ